MKKLEENTLSSLLLRAVNDAKEIEKRNDIKLNMGVWVHRLKNGCEVCMAGAVMIGLNPDLVKLPYGVTFPFNFEENIARKLHAIDYMRSGIFNIAYEKLYTSSSQAHENCFSLDNVGDIVRCDYDYKILRAPWSTYETVAEMLKKDGL